MTEAEWDACTFAARQLDHLHRTGRRGVRKVRLLACAALRLPAHQPAADAVRAALEVAERYADGLADAGELDGARAAAAPAAARLSRSVWFGDEPTSRDVWYVAATDPVGWTPGAVVVSYTWVNSSFRSVFAFRAQRAEAALVREVYGNPFRPVELDPSWRTEAVVALAAGIYADRAFDRLPVLADALEDAGCANPDVLGHCRSGGPHTRGCWVVDLILGKE